MKKQWRLFLLAIGFFTRIPVPDFPDFQESDLNLSVKFFPLIGIGVGAFTALIFWLSVQAFPQEIAVILSMIAGIFLTGCFHEDGLADTFDGFGGGWNKLQVLSIMQDSRIGSYGATALFLALLLKFATLSHLPLAVLPVTLIAGHSLSRYAALLVIMTQAYVRSEGKAKPLATQLSRTDFLLASVIGLSPLAFMPGPLIGTLLPVALVWLTASAKYKQRIGGYTGDCLGAMQQLAEIGFYLGVLAFGHQ